jgi:putative hydrolase of the HAD superfamily
MYKKAIIFDLDNTVYPVHSIGEDLFAPLFTLIKEDGNHAGDLDKIKDAIMRKPFQLVAREYDFSDELTAKGIALLKDIEYTGKIEPFEDYRFVKDLIADKYLVTTGFSKLQQSKVDGMKIRNDFKEIHIVDPSISDRTKKDVFTDIIERHGYDSSEVLVVGDDPHSEIKAAQDLGIDAILYDKSDLYEGLAAVSRIESFKELINFL